MPKIPVNTALASAALRDAATTLKAAVVVSAAAILSQTKPDLEANAAAAASHLDTFADKLDALRDGIIRGSGNAAALAVLSSTGTAQIETTLLADDIAMIHSQIERVRLMLSAVVSSVTRDGIDAFAEQVGSLGRIFQFIAFRVSEPMPAAPFQYDQLFLETMAELGERDWSEG